jgi:hypothetical protein
MLRFYNPVFLPAYDIVQQFGLAGTQNLLVLGEAYRDAFRSMKNKDAHYYAAASNGIFSTPFGVPFESVLQEARRMADLRNVTGVLGKSITYLEAAVLDVKDTLSQGGLLKGVFKGATLPLMASMHASWSIAWTLDNFVRMSTYHYMKTKGHTDRNAAQVAALAHGDYASVPAKTRRSLNKFFFTPTFKIAMAKAHGRMIKGTYDHFLGNIPKGTTQASLAKRAAMAMFGFITVQMGFDLLMKSWGYDDEEWGRKYVKTIMTEEGPKELVVNWSTPINLFTKYMYRAERLINPDPAERDPLSKFAGEFLYEFHPLYQTAYRLFGTKKRFDGMPIYNEFDDREVQIRDTLKWLVMEEMFPITNSIAEQVSPKSSTRSERQTKAHIRKSIKEWGVHGAVAKALEIFPDWFTFRYVRSTEDKRVQYKLDAMKRRFSADVKREIMEYGRVRPEWYRNYVKRHMEVINDWADKKKKRR